LLTASAKVKIIIIFALNQEKMSEQALRKEIEEKLANFFEMPVNVLEVRPMQGGSINKALLIRCAQGTFFAKFNSLSGLPDLFEKEKEGLEMLSATGSIKVPQVIDIIQWDGQQGLLLEYLENGTPHYDFWNDFGRQLAEMHKHSNASFGLSENNYIGSLVQSNTNHSNWVEFFITERLEPMLSRAIDSGKADASLIDKFQHLYKRLPELMPEEKPSLLHGDLWAGNFMANLDGEPVVFDPSVYYGHREVDLAMSQLFGGFDRAFYDAYNEVFPLSPGWENRMPLYNLYPLLVHVNLFVGSYIQSVKNILSRYS
jgi:protein-ribulosamine 3-kinase